MKLYIYVSVKEANGYTTIFDVWTGYNFPYVKTTQEKSTDQKPDSSFWSWSQQNFKKKEKITIKIGFNIFCLFPKLPSPLAWQIYVKEFVCHVF